MPIDTILSPWTLGAIAIVRMVIYRISGLKIEVVIGTLLYGLALAILRAGKGVIAAGAAFYRGVRSILSEDDLPLSAPDNVLAINRHYRLGLSEIVMSIEKGVIRIDLERYHTLIAGITGSGKTVCLNMILLQLIQRGARFFSKYELHLFDLKESDNDKLALYAPVCNGGYYGIKSIGLERAIEALEMIVARLHQDKSKRFMVIIDELSMFTTNAPNPKLKQRGTEAVLKLANQIRDQGVLIAATQRPHHEAVPRNISSQFERKILFRVEDALDAARMILRVRLSKLPTDVTQLDNGVFVLREPGRWESLRMGRTMLPKLPDDIQTVVDGTRRSLGENDLRLRVLTEATMGLDVGDRIIGVNKVYKAFDGLTNNDVAEYYRHYAACGAFEPVYKNGTTEVAHYILRVPARMGQRLSRQYIQAGKWGLKNAPLGGGGASSGEIA